MKGTLNAQLCLKHTDYSYLRGRREDISFTRCENITKEVLFFVFIENTYSLGLPRCDYDQNN